MAEKKNENLIQAKEVSRPPVVVVLGHIDHGKTTLLDFIRKTRVAEKESGGITQHIGAYQVEHHGKEITFIDTPGHEAFSQIRSRGARVADIAILIIDASESVQPQAKEAISHIKEAEIPMIIALNKMDKADANPEKAKRELAKEGILTESLGGKVPSVEISAKTGQGISDLLELIILVAEMENLKADVTKPAEGVIIESYLDSFRGSTATLLLSKGKLNVGQIIGTKSTFGKLKTLEDFQGNPISQAFPSQVVVVLGFEDVPRVGEEFKVFSDTEEAENNLKIEERKAAQISLVEPEQKAFNLILKTDVLGSSEAIEEVLNRLPQEKVVLRILKSGAGEINESDVKLAQSSKALILGFRVKVSPIAKSLAQREKVKIMNFEIIYDLVEGVRKYLERLLEPKIVRVDLGKMKVLVNFWSEKNRQIVGGRIIEGALKKGLSVEILRNEELIGKGKMISLQKNKKDIEKASKGEEVGILYEGDKKIEEGDILIFYTEERKKGEL